MSRGLGVLVALGWSLLGLGIVLGLGAYGKGESSIYRDYRGHYPLYAAGVTLALLGALTLGWVYGYPVS